MSLRRSTLALLLISVTTFVPAETSRPRHAQGTAITSAETSLTQREEALQLLNRFTFGPRPGDVEHVLAVGPETWLEQQLDPDHIADPTLAKRLADFPTLTLQPADALTIFPDRQMIKQTAEGTRPYPADPELAAVYQVQVMKYLRSVGKKQGKPAAADAETETDAEKKSAQARAREIAGQLLVLPARDRMAALLRMPVEDRIAFARHVPPEQRATFQAELPPRDRELFLTLASNVNASGQIVAELQQGKLLRDILSERQLLEVMSDFWFNHFNVDARKEADQWYTTSYERDAIRAHALGHFRDLLVATATSPAMMVYLDNWLSVGPDSLASNPKKPNPNLKRAAKGLNENYGREVMELHTLSVDGGYTQADVTALSAILTGWTVDKPYQGGAFVFDPRRHEPGQKQWLGHTLNSSGDGMAEGREALALLAQSPQTAHFISYLLVQRFVADTPPPALVDRLTTTYLSTDGDIRAMIRALAHSPEFRSRRYVRNKIKTPLEFVASTFRATATDPSNPAALANTLRDMGMPLFQQQPPTGYLLTADHWMNSAALVSRLNFAYTLTGNHYGTQSFDSPRLLALALMTKPSAQSVATSNTLARCTSVTTSSASAHSVPNLTEALHLLEPALIGAPLNSRTEELIRQKLAALSTPTTTPTDTLNLVTALLIGSPDFQLH